jgi:hypothetical protein
MSNFVFNRHPAQGAFGGVVGETDAAIVEEAGERRQRLSR